MATAAKKKSATAARKGSAPGRKAAVRPQAALAPAVPAKKAVDAPKNATASKPSKEPKAQKPKKPKLVRDSFTLSKGEYAVLQMLKERAAKGGTPARKSELLRAGIQALAGMQDGAFLAAIAAVPALKTGRPAKA